MVIKIYPQNPNEKAIAQVVQRLRDGGVAVIPTDGMYAFGCALSSPKAIERLKVITGCKDSDLDIMCGDLSHIADYAKVDTPAFKILKRNLPGPFTFILPASSRVPDKVLGKRKAVSVRIADNAIPTAVINELGCPLVTLSEWPEGEQDEQEYITDPELIEEQWGGFVDMVIDAGHGGIMPTTLVDLTQGDPEILRQGEGELVL